MLQDDITSVIYDTPPTHLGLTSLRMHRKICCLKISITSCDLSKSLPCFLVHFFTLLLGDWVIMLTNLDPDTSVSHMTLIVRVHIKMLLNFRVTSLSPFHYFSFLLEAFTLFLLFLWLLLESKIFGNFWLAFSMKLMWISSFHYSFLQKILRYSSFVHSFRNAYILGLEPTYHLVWVFLFWKPLIIWVCILSLWYTYCAVS